MMCPIISSVHYHNEMHRVLIHATLCSVKQGKSEGFHSCDRPSNLTQIGFKSSIFQPSDLEIWLMTSKNYRTPLLHYIKLCASSQIPRWIRTAGAVRKRSFRVKIDDFLPRMTLKFNGWAWNTIGILFNVTLSFVHHFKAIGELKLKLQSGNAQFGPKWAIFCPVWPSNLMDNIEKQ